MDLVTLRAFVTVADLGSFSRAAEVLHVSQPVVSQQVKRLERDLGVEVLLRSTRRVELTAAGARLLPRARVVLTDVARAEAESRMLGDGVAGRVSVGFVGTATYDLLPRVARSVRDRFPDVELEVYGEQLTPVLVEGLLSRRLDVAVMRAAAADPALTVRPLREEALVLALPVDHPLAQDGPVPLAALRGSTFVTHPSGHRSAMHDAAVQAWRAAGFVPGEVVEVRETATLVAFVAAGIGVALVPAPVRSLAVRGVSYHPLADVDARVELVLGTRPEEVPAAVEHVVDLVRAAAATASAEEAPSSGSDARSEGPGTRRDGPPAPGGA